MDQRTISIDIPDATVRPGRMVAPTSFLAHRLHPATETILLPEATIPGGTLTLTVGNVRMEPPGQGGRLDRLRSRKPSVIPVPEGRVGIDFRFNLYRNWGHLLNNHLPLSFRMIEATGVDWSDVLVILPAELPEAFHQAVALFGLETLGTDAIVEGPGILYDMEPWTGQRAERADWVRLPQPVAALQRSLAEGEASRPLPKKVFLSRRGTREPSNNAEVTAWLGERGFELVYTEDLAPADQVRLFAGADDLVAVHGAGLSWLLYCGVDGGLGGGPDRLVEILPCGHVSDFFRVIADHIGLPYMAVRGKMKPEYVEPSYALDDETFAKFSLDSFEIDLNALAEVMALTDPSAGEAPTT